MYLVSHLNAAVKKKKNRGKKERKGNDCYQDKYSAFLTKTKQKSLKIQKKKSPTHPQPKYKE